MTDQVHTEAAALRSLRGAVTRYAERMREAMAAARRDADALVRRTEDALRRRKSELDRALGALEQARAALAGCRDPRQAAALQAEVAARQRFADERKQSYHYAQQAAGKAADARTNLVKVMQTLEASVGEHSSVATTALGNIEGKLAQIGLPDLGPRVAAGVSALASRVETGAVHLAKQVGGEAAHLGAKVVQDAKSVALGLGVAAEIASGASHAAQTVREDHEASLGRAPSISEMRREQTNSQQEQYAEGKKKELEDHAGEVPKL